VRVEIVKVCNGDGESSPMGRENSGGVVQVCLFPMTATAAAMNLSFCGIGAPVENNLYIYIYMCVL